MSMKTASFLPQVQSLRGIAALMVAVIHIGGALQNAGLPDPLPDLAIGNFGVDLFFVISGFIMLRSTQAEAGLGASARFMVRRLIRIVPLYWLMLTITAVMILHENRHGGIGRHETWHIVTSYLFVPLPSPDDIMDFYPIYPQGWTLDYEMAFYVCFAVAILWAPRLRLPTLGTFLVALVVLGGVLALPPPLLYYARSNVLEFVFGMLIARIAATGLRLPALVTLGLVAGGAAAAQAFAPLSDDWDVIRGLGWGIPAAVIVAALVLVRPGRPNGLTKALQPLGDASYSLYLLHGMVYEALLWLCLHMFPLQDVRFRFLVPSMLAGAVITSLTFHRAVERPVTRFLQRVAADTRPRVWSKVSSWGDKGPRLS